MGQGKAPIPEGGPPQKPSGQIGHLSDVGNRCPLGHWDGGDRLGIHLQRSPSLSVIGVTVKSMGLMSMLHFCMRPWQITEPLEVSASSSEE